MKTHKSALQTLAMGLLLSITLCAFAPPVRGQVFVSYSNGKIRKFDSGGTATIIVSGLSSPKGLALNAGNLYVADPGNNTLWKFPLGGTSSVFANTSGGPYGLVFDSAGKLYTANYSSSTVGKFSSAGFPAGSPFPVTSANMNGPFGLALDSAGNVYAASHNNNTIQKFDAAGNFLGDFVSFGGGGLTAPRGVAFKAGILYVANYIDSTVKMFDGTGAFLGNFATAADGVLNPTGIAFDCAGSLYVANAGDFKIMKFPPIGGVGSVFALTYAETPEFIAIQCEPAALTLNLYAGLTIQGTIGCQYRIEYATSLNNPSWIPLATITLTSSPYVYVDATVPAGTRFYQAVLLP